MKEPENMVEKEGEERKEENKKGKKVMWMN
jgi:hypothetical protein